MKPVKASMTLPRCSAMRYASCSLPTAIAEKASPASATKAFTCFHSLGSIRSISRMPSANIASISMGSASR